jgi:D-serine deaminase-like pyridoxal phosphate-dependent protein
VTETHHHRILQQHQDRVLEYYGDAIGCQASEVVTPALLLDLPAAKRNIARMGREMADMSMNLRPHIKVHKSVQLSRLQIEAGAIGLSVATVWEAAAMAAAGMDDIFIVNTVTHPAKIDRLVNLAETHRVYIAVDDADNVTALSSAAQRVGVHLGVFIEVDTGMDRAGVDTPAQALALARHICDVPNVVLTGITGYEGHCSLEPDAATRAAKHRVAMDHFTAVADVLRAEGIPVELVSAGGTATWRLGAADRRLTELQAGSYVVMDNFHGVMVSDFEFALFVATTVISKPPGRVIVDAGNKSVGIGGGPSMAAPPLAALRFDEEHGIFPATADAPKLGETVRLIPGYAPATVNLYDAYLVMEDEIIVDVWPVLPRGPQHVGLLHA